METEIFCNGSYLIIQLSGELDQHMADQIRGRIDYGLLREGMKHMIFDFTEVSFMDSSGIGMLLKRYKQVKQLGGTLYITGCNQSILRLVKLSGLERIVVIEDTIHHVLKQY